MSIKAKRPPFDMQNEASKASCVCGKVVKPLNETLTLSGCGHGGAQTSSPRTTAAIAALMTSITLRLDIIRIAESGNHGAPLFVSLNGKTSINFGKTGVASRFVIQLLAMSAR